MRAAASAPHSRARDRAVRHRPHRVARTDAIPLRLPSAAFGKCGQLQLGQGVLASPTKSCLATSALRLSAVLWKRPPCREVRRQVAPELIREEEQLIIHPRAPQR